MSYYQSQLYHLPGASGTAMTVDYSTTSSSTEEGVISDNPSCPESRTNASWH